MEDAAKSYMVDRIRVEQGDTGMSPCWTWTLAPSSNGYPIWKRRDQYRGQYVHRIAYEFNRGGIPEGLTVDHLCRNRACVNPDHLEAVPLAENVRRARGVWGQADPNPTLIRTRRIGVPRPYSPPVLTSKARAFMEELRRG